MNVIKNMSHSVFRIFSYEKTYFQREKRMFVYEEKPVSTYKAHGTALYLGNGYFLSNAFLSIEDNILIAIGEKLIEIQFIGANKYGYDVGILQITNQKHLGYLSSKRPVIFNTDAITSGEFYSIGNSCPEENNIAKTLFIKSFVINNGRFTYNPYMLDGDGAGPLINSKGEVVAINPSVEILYLNKFRSKANEVKVCQNLRKNLKDFLEKKYQTFVKMPEQTLLSFNNEPYKPFFIWAQIIIETIADIGQQPGYKNLRYRSYTNISTKINPLENPLH